MAPKLYMMPMSAPCRAVLITAKHINLELEQKLVNLMKGENKTPEYLKLNPQHTIPTIDDNGFVLWESHAIIPYLVEKYAKDDSLYPKDPQKRAVINQRLHFDNGVLVSRFGSVARPLFREGKQPTEKDLEPLSEAYDFLEAFLQKGEHIAGNSLSVADFSLVSSLSTTDLFVPVDAKKWPKLSTWFKKMQALPAYEANKEGLEVFKAFLKK